MTITRGKTLAATLTVLGTALSLNALAAPSQAADRAHHFANCTAMHRVWHHGVAVSARASRRDGHGAPVRPAVYRANKGSDRDGDGVACEQ
jgi:hypothetical protein